MSIDSLFLTNWLNILNINLRLLVFILIIVVIVRWLLLLSIWFAIVGFLYIAFVRCSSIFLVVVRIVISSTNAIIILPILPFLVYPRTLSIPTMLSAFFFIFRTHFMVYTPAFAPALNWWCHSFHRIDDFSYRLRSLTLNNWLLNLRYIVLWSFIIVIQVACSSHYSSKVSFDIRLGSWRSRRVIPVAICSSYSCFLLIRGHCSSSAIISATAIVSRGWSYLLILRPPSFILVSLLLLGLSTIGPVLLLLFSVWFFNISSRGGLFLSVNLDSWCLIWRSLIFRGNSCYWVFIEFGGVDGIVQLRQLLVLTIIIFIIRQGLLRQVVHTVAT